jgi:two-component system OmpR family response regulator
MPRKILIVDDDQKTRLLLKSYLEKNQYEVVLAHNGDSFMAEFQRHADQISHGDPGRDAARHRRLCTVP